MRILLVNYHYFINGGPDRYFFNVKSALESAGHIVVPFCFNYDETLDNEFEEYFPEPIFGKGAALLSQRQLTKRQKIIALVRMFHNPEVNTKLRRLIEREKPDLMYSIYLSSTLLPNILKIAKKEYGLPVIYRISDFHLFCPSYLFCRDGEICTDCVGNLLACVKNCCVKNSKLMSLVRAAQIKANRFLDYYKFVDVFVTPSNFMRNFMIQKGYDPCRVIHIPTFAKDLLSKANKDNAGSKKRILFLGNISREKGVDLLIDAYCKSKTDMPLELLGKGDKSYVNELKQKIFHVGNKRINVRGFLQGNELEDIINEAAFLVHPAVCYENMPNSVLEMLSRAIPIIASDIGSLPELVKHKQNGLLVAPRNVQGLADAIDEMSMSTDLENMGEFSRSLYEQIHTEQKHMDKLLELQNKLVNKSCSFS